MNAMDVFKPHVFNTILNNARSTNFPGAWEGSSFRDHPCGIIRGNIKLTNQWRTRGDCSISITDGDGWDTKNICRESCANGDPHPKPIGGRAIGAWSFGKWADEDTRVTLEPIVRKILTEALYHSIAHDSWKAAIQAQQSYSAQIAHIDAKRAALAKAA